MKKKVLVYDNQLGYYDLVNDTVKNGYDFFLYKKEHEEQYDAVVFFLHDDLELLDMVKLYDPEIPFILGTSKKSTSYLKGKDTVFIIDISLTRDEIVQNLVSAFNKVGHLNEKEEAL